MLECRVLGRLLQVAVQDLARSRETTRSTPAGEAGAAKYCLTILASAGHFFIFKNLKGEKKTNEGGPVWYIRAYPAQDIRRLDIALMGPLMGSFKTQLIN